MNSDRTLAERSFLVTFCGSSARHSSMTPKDLFQTAIRVVGVVFLYFSIPRALSDILTLPDTIHTQALIGVLGAIFRILWEIVVPWRFLMQGAGFLRCTRRLFPARVK